MNDRLKMAIITSCYNRKDLSVKSINSILKAALIVPKLDIRIFVWDDDSTDGTADALEAVADCIRVFRGSGDYYWSRSMHAAMSEAVKDDFDLYLMINDDSLFCEESLRILIDDYNRAGGKCGIVGSMKFDGAYTYGGRDRYYNGIHPDGTLQRCRYSNWNCFLIDRFVVQNVGLICEKYKHSWGDYDYSCQMNRKNIPQYVASQYVGECRNDNVTPKYLDPSINPSERLKNFFSPKGEPPGDFFRFHWVDKRFKGLLIAAFYYTALLLKVVFLKPEKGSV